MSALLDELRLALTAVQYFTRVPVPGWVGHTERRLNDAARYFPLVGMLVGALAGGVFLLAAAVFPAAIAVLVSMVAGIVVTGAFHEDGLADTCDGFGGGADKRTVLAIMKDSRVGAFGVIGLVLALALKYAALSSLPVGEFFAVVVSGHAFSRFMALTLIFTQTYARDEGETRAKSVARDPSAVTLVVGALAGIAPLAWLGEAALAAAGGALVVRIGLARYFHRRIGGYTGDCLGAVQQATEIAFYLGVVAWGAR